MKNNYTVLSNFDLLDIIKSLNLTPYFGGVYSKSEFETLPLKKALFIVNLDDFDGSHWCCFSTMDNLVVYNDSYGFKPPIDVDNYIKKVTNKKSYVINTIQNQHLLQTFCGYFCCFFLWWIINTSGTINDKLKYYNELFNSEDLKDNYNKLLKYYNLVYKNY